MTPSRTASSRTARISSLNFRQPEYSQVITHYDAAYETYWCYMNAEPRACFTPTMLRELNHCFSTLKNNPEALEEKPIRFMVLGSKAPGVYNLGGDLNLFRELILTHDRDGLLHYATTCVTALYAKMTIFEKGMVHITLVQGDALGGGMECALSSDLLIAERSAKMGMPEILFNLFPGMGAYSLLSRKIGSTLAERLILSGKVYTAAELHEMGVVDVLAEDGKGELSVYDCIKKETRNRNGRRALRMAKNCCNPVSLEELMNITTIWVDAALRLKYKDLRMMERLVNKQLSRSYRTD